ncbi:MAG: hypothetical protein QM589_08510 [Thermomicrobiales bacterium]
MSDDTRTNDPERPPSSEATPEPAIPDGGLPEAMPDWLRRPPAWRGMVVPEIPESASEGSGAVSAETGEPVATPEDDASGSGTEGTIREPKFLPEPDRTPIDPSSLIELDDLPSWLVELGKRDRSGTSRSPEVHLQPGTAITVQAPVSDGESSVPVPPSLRDELLAASEPLAPPANTEAASVAGLSQRFLVLAGVLVVVIVVAILLSVFG